MSEARTSTDCGIADGSRKRQRTDEHNTEGDEPEVTHHPTLWLNDGNIVLVADKIAFRVHSSILAMNSTVFKDMFAIPLADDSPRFEGHPVVLLDDQPSQLADFLHYMYRGARCVI